MSGVREATGRAFARAALLGNPSDGFGGKTIGVIVPRIRRRGARSRRRGAPGSTPKPAPASSSTQDRVVQAYEGLVYM
ncbi:MAG TPA: hypothetical protein VFY37_10205, partial [Solirubrobacterales bacterium]|nr:hypothetical protein [Solirubrobacterales bacterium]